MDEAFAQFSVLLLDLVSSASPLYLFVVFVDLFFVVVFFAVVVVAVPVSVGGGVAGTAVIVLGSDVVDFVASGPLSVGGGVVGIALIPQASVEVFDVHIQGPFFLHLYLY